MVWQDAVTILKSLKDKGVRFTPQRQAILEYLLSTDTHPTAEEIYKQVKKNFPGVSLGTIYNTLNMLKEHHYVMELSCGDMSSHFDGNPQVHYHVMCSQCGKVVDLHTSVMNMDEMVEEATGFRVITHSLIFYGICPKCYEQEKSMECEM